MTIELFKPYPLTQFPEFFNIEVNTLVATADTSLGFQQKKYPKDFTPEFKVQFKEYLEMLLKSKLDITNRGCLNITKYMGVINEVKWHNENGFSYDVPVPQIITKNPYLCLFWIKGKTDYGGEFRCINDTTGDLIIVPFNPPGFIVMTRDTIHSVTHYSSEEFRVSFNVDFDFE